MRSFLSVYNLKHLCEAGAVLAQRTLRSHDSHTPRTPRASIIGGARKSGLAYSDPGLTYTENQLEVSHAVGDSQVGPFQ